MKKLSSEKIIQDFINALKEKDFDYLAEILDRKGEYQIQDKNYKLQPATRFEFLKWLKAELDLDAINKVQIKRCVGCKRANTVVVFNDGNFGYTKTVSAHADKAGFMICFNDQLITEIKFCMNMRTLKHIPHNDDDVFRRNINYCGNFKNFFGNAW